jgi:CDGSH-type Zn-finger protein
VKAITCLFVTEDTGKQALPVKFQKMEEKKENKSQAIVEVINSESLKITGNFILQDQQRNKESKPEEEVYLCRCGRSSDKPFCDGSHKNR